MNVPRVESQPFTPPLTSKNHSQNANSCKWYSKLPRLGGASTKTFGVNGSPTSRLFWQLSGSWPTCPHGGTGLLPSGSFDHSAISWLRSDVSSMLPVRPLLSW